MSRSSVSIIAKEQGLSHVGLGYYSDKTGKITHRSKDGTTLTPNINSDIQTTKKNTSLMSVQQDPTMPDPLGKPSTIEKVQPKVKKKKSLVEFVSSHTIDKREKNYTIKYKIPATGTKIQILTIKALNPKDATAKAKAFVDRITIIGTPQVAKN